MASFLAYQGCHLTNLELILKDLFKMDPDDVEEMDLNWQMVMVAYRTQQHANENWNCDTPAGGGKHRARQVNRISVVQSTWH